MREGNYDTDDGTEAQLVGDRLERSSGFSGCNLVSPLSYIERENLMALNKTGRVIYRGSNLRILFLDNSAARHKIN